MVQHSHSLRGILIAGMIVAGSVWAYKHLTAAHTGGHLTMTASEMEASPPPRHRVGPVPETGSPSLVEKIAIAGKTVLKKTPLRSDAETIVVDQDSPPPSHATPEERIKSHYTNLQ